MFHKKKAVPICKKFAIFYSQETPVTKSLLNKFVGRKASKFIKMRPQHRCFPVNIAKFFMLSCEYCKISKNTYFEEHLHSNFFLGSCFQNHSDLVILQIYQPLSQL